MTNDLVTLERKGDIGLVTIDNPPLNILSAAVRPQLRKVLEHLKGDETVRAIVLTGAGERSFCAGADMHEEEGLTRDTVRSFLEADRQIYDLVSSQPSPVIAAIEGHCMGGGLELALACDVRIARSSAKFCAPGVKIGLVVSTTRMTRLVGPAVTTDLILSGRTFSGDEAARVGLISRAVPEDAKGSALEYAEVVATRAPLAVRRAKQAIDEAVTLPYDEAFARELDHFADLASTSDHKEGIRAFFERRQPDFTAT